ETASIVSCRSSSATWRTCSIFSLRRSSGVLMVSRSGVLLNVVTAYSSFAGRNQSDARWVCTAWANLEAALKLPGVVAWAFARGEGSDTLQIDQCDVGHVTWPFPSRPVSVAFASG